MHKPPQTKPKLYQTYIPTRDPQWKPHTKLGQAKNAVIQKISYGYASGSGYWVGRDKTTTEPMEVWKLTESGEWELLWSISKDTPRDELPWKK